MAYRTALVFVPFSIALLLSACKEETVELLQNNNHNDTTVSAMASDSLRLNQIQVIGSHNSYRLKTYEPLFNFLQGISGILPSSLDPDGLDYTHLPLDSQFSDYGIRQIELDIYYDPNGGLFYNRVGNRLINEPVESNIPELNQPGFKVLHIADIDYQTNYFTFRQALQAVKDWSDAHPRHLPIFILIETKETTLAGIVPLYPWTETLPFDAAAMDAIDREIKDVFGESLGKVITPDDVRGEFATLNEAVTTAGWPRIGESRGKVVFLLNNGGSVKDYYLQGHPSLQGRIMFVNSGAGKPESAFIMENNSKQTADIRQWVKQGYLIRTRADDGTDEARTGDVSSRDSALASGAQLISTDYYRPDPRHDTSSVWTDYSVRFPGNAVARLNPVNGPAWFSGGAFE
ncbi:MAG TPA: phosphatidylinositol-specific phospholipase C1-like protein [Chitinophagales bacterium]|nr:phosphatidylinositol-specific phospholipase C1-like protein [Chitinophagales bacterium]